MEKTGKILSHAEPGKYQCSFGLKGLVRLPRVTPARVGIPGCGERNSEPSGYNVSLSFPGGAQLNRAVAWEGPVSLGGPDRGSAPPPGRDPLIRFSQ